MTIRLPMFATLALAALPAVAELNFPAVVLDASFVAYERDVGDVDGDAHADLLALEENVGQNRIDLYWHEATDATGTSWTEVIRFGDVPRSDHAEGFQGTRLAQLEAGGSPEVVISSFQGPYYFTIPANPATGTWPRVFVAANDSDEGIGIEDIDDDGDLDLAFTSGNSKNVMWARNPGDGSPNWTVFTIGSFSEADWIDRCEAVDLNGDGRVDILATEENSGASPDALAVWWEQPAPSPTNGSWTRRTITTRYTLNSMDVADVDQDGDPDVVLAEHQGAKRISVYANDGTGTFTEYAVGAGKENHLGGRLLDLDGDGDLDLAGIAYNDSAYLHVWRNDSPGGTPTAARPTISPNGGVFDEPLPVTLACTTPSADIWYTLDGTIPTNATPSLHYSTTPLLLSSSTTLRARAYRTGLAPSAESSATFTLFTLGSVAHWRFDERFGTTAYDDSGSGHHATIAGATRVAGTKNRALDLDGSDDHVDAGTWEVTGTSLTLCAWVRIESPYADNDARILSKATGSAEQDHVWMLSLTSDSGNVRPRFRLKTDGTTTTLIPSSGTLALDTWVHLAAVYDGAAMRLFINGAQAASQAKSGEITASTASIFLGANPPSIYAPFAGALDDVRIYNTALDGTNLQAMMNEAPPDAAWQANATFFDELADSVGAQLYLYAYWPWRDDPLSDQDGLSAAFEQVRAALSSNGPPVRIIPVGEAFRAAVNEMGSGELAGLTRNDLYRDSLHPSDIGYYLIALVHFAVLHRRSPVGLPAQGISSDEFSDAPVAIPSNIAAAFQRIAWDVARHTPHTGVTAGRYDEWFNASGLPGDAAPTNIPYSDGIANLTRWALGMGSGSGADLDHLPRIALTANGQLEIRYGLGADAADAGVTFRHEWSDDIQTWALPDPASLDLQEAGGFRVLTFPADVSLRAFRFQALEGP